MGCRIEGGKSWQAGGKWPKKLNDVYVFSVLGCEGDGECDREREGYTPHPLTPMPFLSTKVPVSSYLVFHRLLLRGYRSLLFPNPNALTVPISFKLKHSPHMPSLPPFHLFPSYFLYSSIIITIFSQYFRKAQ